MINSQTNGELCVLTRVIDGSDPIWDERATAIGTLEQLRETFDLSKGIPYGWRLLKGKKARRFLRNLGKDEARYQRDMAARKNANQN